MNIHFFHSDPVINATFLDDIRARKMILENLQMMSSALHKNGIDDQFKPLTKQGSPFRVTHINHPSTIWASSSRANLLWLCDYTEALYERYRRSGGTAYKNVPDNLQRVRYGALRISEERLTEFVNCARSKDLGIDYTHVSDIHKAYFGYMNDRWDMDTIKLTWSGVEI